MSKFNLITFIKEMVELSPRQFEGETRARNLIVKILGDNQVPYMLQTFHIDLPRTQRVWLKADNELLECDGCSMVGGKIDNKEEIISSLASISEDRKEANINFNPKCPDISNVEYHFLPAISVNHKSLKKILKAKIVEGELKVSKEKHKTANILAGNTKDPEHICFAHYDSIKKGAIDNASGVAVVMSVIFKKPETLKNTLYVFSACEELSYDQPVYWGYGFRKFEKKYYNILDKAKKIFIIDSVGHSQTNIIKDTETIKEGFPIKNLEKWSKKIYFLAGDLDKLMTVYHSDMDDGRYIKQKRLQETEEKLINQISKKTH